MNKFIKISILALLIGMINTGGVLAQIRWNPASIESSSATSAAVYTVIGDTMRVTNVPLSGSGPNYRDDFRLNRAFRLLKSEPVIALRIKGNNCTYRSADRKIELLYQTKVSNATTVNFTLNSGTQTPTKSLDLDGDGVPETFLWNMSTRMASFTQDTIVPYFPVWTPNEPNGTRAWLKFVGMFEPAAGATADMISYDITHFATYASEYEAELALTPKPERDVPMLPIADVQFRTGTTNQNPTGVSFEIRSGNASAQDYAFVAGMKFDIANAVNNKKDGEILLKAELRLTVSHSRNDLIIYPFTTDFDESGGGPNSYANKKAYIDAAVMEEPAVYAFRPNWAGSSIFEWTNFATTRISSYQTTVDITDHFQKQIAAGKDTVGLLLAPVSTSTGSFPIVLSKDISASNQMSGTIGGNRNFDDEGNLIDNSDVTRWSRIVQLLRISGFDTERDLPTAIKELHPTLTLTFGVPPVPEPRKFTHPGISYTQADLDRMKAMVKAEQEPYYSTYLKLLKETYSQPGNGNYGAITSIAEGGFNGTIGTDGRRAHDMALLYHITGEKKYADDAVARLNRYRTLTSASGAGTGPLDNGKLGPLLNAAELLRDYEGWLPEDQQAFKNALVYPMYSTTARPSGDVGFYWNIYQFDRARYGNQGLFAARSLMAMGIYLDNDTIYDRAYRYLLDMPSRPDDLPYPSAPVSYETGQIYSGEYYAGIQNVYNVPSYKPYTRENEYHYDETLKYYIFKSGQMQESSRDNSHVFAGLGNYAAIAEMAWSQGDSLYSCLDNRLLTGLEWSIRYNLSYVRSYPDQLTPWEPVGSSRIEDECTFDNGKYFQVRTRSGRWELLAVRSAGRGAITGHSAWRTQALAHYKVRAGLAPEKHIWLQRAYDDMMERYGYEGYGEGASHAYEWDGWGTLTKYRENWMAGDPGTWVDGVRKSGMPSVTGTGTAGACTIKAVDYDFYAENGEGHTYHNVGTEKSEHYRTDGTVEIARNGDHFVVTSMEKGEWLNYTVGIPVTGKYTISAAVTVADGEGSELSFAVNNEESVIAVPMNKTSGTAFITRTLGTVTLPAGANVLRIMVTGESNRIQIRDIRIQTAFDGEGATTFTGQLNTAGSNYYSTKWTFENMLPTNVNVLRSGTSNRSEADTILLNTDRLEFTDFSISGTVPTYYYWLEYTNNGKTLYTDSVYFEWGHFFDSFDDPEVVNWTTATGSKEMKDDVMELTFGTSGTTSLVNPRRSEAPVLHAGNYPFLAFELEKPTNAAISLRNDGTNSFGGTTNKQTGIVNSTIYYYDLRTDIFKLNAGSSSGTAVPVDNILKPSAFQIHLLGAASMAGQKAKLHWIGTFKTLQDIIDMGPSSVNYVTDMPFSYFVSGRDLYLLELPEKATVNIYSILGQSVISTNASSEKITLPNEGMYIVNVIMPDKVNVAFKIVVK